jgi:hypothetical protein
MADEVRRFRFRLALILAVSAVLRIALALRGGQYAFGDELRMNRGAATYIGLLGGDARMVRDALSWPEHAGFTPIATVVTAGQHGLTFLTGQHDWSHGEQYFASAALAAALLGLFSTLNIWLVHGLARAAGAKPPEAEWAALLAASSSALFYYSRHLLPYDCAMAAGLAACLLALRNRPADVWWSGVCAGLCYEIYNGYWFFVPVAAIALLASRQAWPVRAAAFGRWLAAALLVVVLLTLPGALIGGGKYWEVLASFGRSARQGEFREGWSLPWAYLWHAEHWLGVAVIVAIISVLIGRRRHIPFRAWLWLGLAAAIWTQLVLGSTVFERIVVYGRSARALVPFLALLGGYAAAELLATRPRWRAGAAAFVTLAGALNFLPHFQLVFPRDIREAILRDVGVPKEAFVFSGCTYEPPGRPITRPDLVLVNAQGLYPLRDYIGYPAGRTLLALPSLASFPPYQYEGHTPRERQLLRQHDVSIRLIQLADPAAVPDGPPRRFRYGPADYPDGFAHGRP